MMKTPEEAIAETLARIPGAIVNTGDKARIRAWEITLAEANQFLTDFGYDENWTREELAERTRNLSPNYRQRLALALRITGEAKQASADALEAEGLSKE